MHGTVLIELKHYVTSNHGQEGWKALLEASGIGAKSYLATNTYPDEEVVALVRTASNVTGTPIPAILKDFGVFIAPSLIKMYKAYVKPHWTSLDLIEHTEKVIHKAVRLRNPGAAPPRLQAERRGPDEVAILYRSERQMCTLAEGIMQGVANHYDETVRIEQTTCMHRGDSECTIVAKAAA